MNGNELEALTKVIVERVNFSVSHVDEIAYVSRYFDANPVYKGNSRSRVRERSIVVDVLDDNSNRVSISVYVVLNHSIERNVPEIVYDLQKLIIKNVEAVTSYKVKNVDVTVVGVIFK